MPLEREKNIYYIFDRNLIKIGQENKFIAKMLALLNRNLIQYTALLARLPATNYAAYDSAD